MVAFAANIRGGEVDEQPNFPEFSAPGMSSVSNGVHGQSADWRRTSVIIVQKNGHIRS